MANFPVFHGISLAENSLIENLTIERLAADPGVLVAGRCWFNTVEKVLKFAGLDAGGAIQVNVLSTGSSSATVLADANSYTDGAIAALVGAAPAVLDTLNEIAAALANDPNFATTIVASVTAVTNSVGTLSNLTTTAQSNVVAAINEVDADIAAEAVARAAADTTLQGNITTEAGTRASGDTNLQTQIGTLANLTTASKTNVVVAVNELNANAAQAVTDNAAAFTAEAAARVLGDSTEATARTSGDSALQGQIGTLGNLTTTDKTTVVASINEVVSSVSSEASTRASADTTLTTNLTTEVTNRTNADTSIRTDFAAADTSIRTDFATADTALQTQIGTLGNLTTVDKTNVVLAINELVSAGAGSGAANTAAILAEETARIAADGVLQGNIDAEATARAGADSTLTTNLATEVTNRTNADSTLTTNLAAEVTNRTTAVADEAAARTAAITAETVIRVAAEGVIQGNVDAEATTRAAADALRVLKAGDTMSGNLAFGGTKTVTGLVNPTDPTDAATKAYVDSLASGLVWLDPVTLVNFTGSSASPVGSPVLYDSYLIDTGGATGVWSSFAVGDVVQCTNASGPVWTKVTQISVGQHYIVSGITETTPIGIAAGHLTEFATVTNATPGAFAMTFVAPVVGNASFVGEVGAALFGRSYTYAVDSNAPIGNPTHSWIQFGGPGSTGAGVGLVYAGNVLHINLGAGVAQLPSDEVGLDLYGTGGLMLTVDGTAASTDSASQLSVKLDGTTLTLGANGLSVSSSLTAEVTAATAAIAAETTARTTADTTLTTNLATEVTNRTTADTTLQGNIDAEATARAGADTTLQGNIDAEATTRATAVTTLTTNLAGEVTDRAAADVVLQANIDAEASARGSAITAEASARTTADTTLQTNITNEASARAAADTLVRADFAAADTALQGTLQGNIDAEATARAAADVVLQGNIDTLTTAVGGGVAAEASARAAADTTLQGNIDTLSGTVTTFRSNVNASRFTFLAGAAAVQHTISHNLNSAFVDFTVLVQRDNGKFRNDVVSVEATDDNTLTVYLTESRVIKASVVALSNAL